MTTRSYLSAEEMAERVGVTAATIRNWARDRVIRGYQPGGRVWLFREAERLYGARLPVVA